MAIIKVPKPGDVLPNHAIVIAAKLTRMDRLVILALKEGYEPYVSWVCNPDDLSSTNSGYYFSSLDNAVKFYNRRV